MLVKPCVFHREIRADLQRYDPRLDTLRDVAGAAGCAGADYDLAVCDRAQGPAARYVVAVPLVCAMAHAVPADRQHHDHEQKRRGVGGFADQSPLQDARPTCRSGCRRRSSSATRHTTLCCPTAHGRRRFRRQAAARIRERSCSSTRPTLCRRCPRCSMRSSLAVDAGGQLVLISTVDKAVPLSTFKQIFRSAYYDKSEQLHPDLLLLARQARPHRRVVSVGGGRYVPAESVERRLCTRSIRNRRNRLSLHASSTRESRSIGCRPAGPRRFRSMARTCLGCLGWRCTCALSLGAVT